LPSRNRPHDKLSQQNQTGDEKEMNTKIYPDSFKVVPVGVDEEVVL